MPSASRTRSELPWSQSCRYDLGETPRSAEQPSELTTHSHMGAVISHFEDYKNIDNKSIYKKSTV